MTIFLCILTAIVAVDFKATSDRSAWGVFAMYALHVVLTLGLATLAVLTWMY